MDDREGQGTHAAALSSAPGTEAELTSLAAHVQELALARDLSLATAESCTGGLVGHTVTGIAGSSAYYVGGVVSYSNASKSDLLGVSETVIETHGAVSAQVARAMAQGVRERLGADIGVSVTGVAGPDGGTVAKPVGLTYVAVAGPGADDVAVRRHLWNGDRAHNKRRSAAAALESVIAVLEGSPRQPQRA